MKKWLGSSARAEPVTWKSIWQLIVRTACNWADINPPHLGAALAFYTMLSLAPLLVISISIAGYVLGSQAASGEVVSHVQDLAGAEAAATVQNVIANTASGSSGVIATVTSVIVLLFGASGVFGELRDSLNRVWRVQTPGSGVTGMVLYRIFALAMVLVAGVLIMALLLAGAFVDAASKYFNSILPLPPAFLQAANFIVTFGGVTLLFAVLYKLIPDVGILWSDVWIGAAVTSVLFTIGKFLISLYLGRATVGSAYGAAGSLVVFMVWIYYSAQIFFLGAEFTRLFSERHGSRASSQPQEAPAGGPPRPKAA